MFQARLGMRLIALLMIRRHAFDADSAFCFLSSSSVTSLDMIIGITSMAIEIVIACAPAQNMPKAVVRCRMKRSEFIESTSFCFTVSL